MKVMYSMRTFIPGQEFVIKEKRKYSNPRLPFPPLLAAPPLCAEATPTFSNQFHVHSSCCLFLMYMHNHTSFLSPCTRDKMDAPKHRISPACLFLTCTHVLAPPKGERQTCGIYRLSLSFFTLQPQHTLISNMYQIFPIIICLYYCCCCCCCCCYCCGLPSAAPGSWPS